jgi:ribosomal protein L37E
MIALGQPILVNCAHCGRHAWHVAVLPGRQKLSCPRCGYQTGVDFSTERKPGGEREFKMDVWPA